jgi:hypothetical protein
MRKNIEISATTKLILNPILSLWLLNNSNPKKSIKKNIPNTLDLSRPIT